MTRARSLFALVTTGLLLASGFTANATAAERPIPVLAYYYIWYNPESWNRAKIDYPLLGRYSSDDTRVLEQHVKWAQYAGIDGFIVSWKHTPALDARLRKLVAIADRLNFKRGSFTRGWTSTAGRCPPRVWRATSSSSLGISRAILRSISTRIRS